LGVFVTVHPVQATVEAAAGAAGCPGEATAAAGARITA